MTAREILKTLDDCYALLKTARRAPREGSVQEVEQRLNRALECLLTDVSDAIKVISFNDCERKDDQRESEAK